MDNLGVYIKALLTSLLAAVSLKLGHVGESLWLFIAAITLDYITGVAAAVYNKRLNSGIGFRGVVKKVGQCSVIAVAVIADEIVAQAGESFGLAISTGGTIVTVVTIWLILNELISILENLAEMDVALPPFLLSAINMLKKRTEALAEKSAPEGGEEEPVLKEGGKR